jgi:hypothetical protein
MTRISVAPNLSLQHFAQQEPDPERRQSGANRVLLHIPKKRLNGVVAADLPSAFVNETGGRIAAGLAHG